MTAPSQYPYPRQTGKGRNQKSPGAHKHTADDLVGPSNTKLLDAKHNLSDVKNTDTARQNIGAAPEKHTHVESDVTRLVDDLSAKIPISEFVAKGDLLVGTGAGAVSRLPAGRDGEAVLADSTTDLGLKFGSVAGAANDVDSPIENVNVVAASGSAYTLPDVTDYTMHVITLTAACTFTFPTAGAGKAFSVRLVQDSTGSRLVTWPGSVKWANGTAPTLSTVAGKVDLFGFACFDGSTWDNLGFRLDSH